MMTHTTSPSCFVGIDVSKDSLQVGILPAKQTFSMPNTSTGIQALCEALRRFAPSWVVLEPTGGYELNVAKALGAAGFKVSRPHAARMHYHAKGKGHTSKTDCLDALALAHYAQCYADELQLWQVDEHQQALKDLSQRRRQLVKMLTQEKNRYHHEELPPEVLNSLKRHMDWLKQEIERIEQAIQALLEKDAGCRQKQILLESMKGIGPVLSRVLLAELPELGTIGRRELGMLVGVRPCHFQSGKWQGQARIQGGRSDVRRSLYMAALSASQHCPEIKALYKRLIAKGLAPKQALVACIHKMVRMLNGILKHQTAYQPGVA